VILGHHRDDILETFFMNLFHGGRLASMPPRLLNEDGDLFLARPLAFVSEEDCGKFAQGMGYPIIPCDLCGSQEGLAARPGEEAPGRLGGAGAGAAAGDVPVVDERTASHLADPTLFDFAGLAAAMAEAENSMQLSDEH
jgi:tRNA 2-thiocytidine biosynthesis protein TtcA